MKTDVPDDYKKICKLSELREKEGKRFFVDDVDVAVYKIGDKVYAMSNICPHQHAALMHSGFIEEGFVTCPAHGWQFDVETGKLPTGGNGLSVFPVIIENEIVYAKVYNKELNW